jgi:hypothetical protein
MASESAVNAAVATFGSSPVALAVAAKFAEPPIYVLTKQADKEERREGEKRQRKREAQARVAMMVAMEAAVKAARPEKRTEGGNVSKVRLEVEPSTQRARAGGSGWSEGGARRPGRRENEMKPRAMDPSGAGRRARRSAAKAPEVQASRARLEEVQRLEDEDEAMRRARWEDRDGRQGAHGSDEYGEGIAERKAPKEGAQELEAGRKGAKACGCTAVGAAEAGARAERGRVGGEAGRHIAQRVAQQGKHELRQQRR